MAVEKQIVVAKSNRLIEASYRLDLIEQRIILAAIVIARETQKGLDSSHLTIEAKRFASMYGMEGGGVYEQLKRAMDSLFHRYVVIHDTDPETGHPRVNNIRWVSKSSYVNGAGVIQLRFEPDMVPYISRLESEFTTYRLEKIGHMTSVHAVRLYELLLQHLSIGKREIEISWLKDALHLVDDYPRLYDFKKWVLDVATSQINEHSDITVSHTQRKTGRTVTHLVFDIKAKSDAKPAKKPKRPTVNDAYVKKHARPGESYDHAVRRLLEEAGQGRLVE
ncbi:MAG: hypothetical protein NVSMB28_21220 [Collimonas sp.]